MAVTSRVPIEFIAVVGVLMVTVAIIEVPRSNMRPPEAAALDAHTWRVPPEARTDATLLPLDRIEAPAPVDRRMERERAALVEVEIGPAERRASERRIARLTRNLERKTRWLDRRRADLAAAELQLLHARAVVGPMERTLGNTLAMPQDTLPALIARRAAVEEHGAAVLAGTRDVNRARARVDELARSVARRRVTILAMQDQLTAMQADLGRSVTRAD